MINSNIWTRLAGIKACVKGRLGPLWWYSAVMFGVQRLGDFINIYIGLWLVPRVIPLSEQGALLPLGQISALLGLPLAVISMPFLKFLTVFSAKGETGKIKALIQDVIALITLSSIVVTIGAFWLSPVLFERMRISGSALVWLLCGLAFANALTPIFSNALQALRQFRVMAVSGVVGPLVRVGALWLWLPVFGVAGFFSAQLLMTVVGLAISAWGLRHVLSRMLARESYRSHWREMGLFTLPILLLIVLNNIGGTCETFVIRHFLPDADSAAYYFISRFAEIPCGIWGAISVAFFPMVSERHESGQESRRMFWHAMAFVLLAEGVIGLLLTWGAPWLLGLTQTWRMYYASYSWLMGFLVLRTILLQAFTCFASHEIACRRFCFVWYVAILTLVECALLYGLAGIGFFEPYLPPRLFHALASIHAGRLDFVVMVIVGCAAASLLCVGAHVGLRAARARKANV
ncbi:MAG: MATE family efflux transporter [Magnetococcus sp. WYHC-3]